MASANKRKSTASRGRKKTTKKQSAPIRREIGATVCGLLALLTILCCFKVNAAFLDLMTSVFRGLIGACVLLTARQQVVRRSGPGA